MSIALAVWSTSVAPGEKKVVETLHDLEIRITNVALDETLSDGSGRTTLKITYNPAPTQLEDWDSDAGPDSAEQMTTVICSLTPEKIEHASVDLVLDSDQKFIFEVTGKNTVYLTGNYIMQRPNGGDSDSEDEDEGAFHLEDVSSDVEVDTAELGGLDDSDDDAGRFEEIHEEPPSTKGKKRSAEGMDVDEEKPSKAQKKAAKKQKGAEGQAVPTPADGEKKKEKEKAKEKEKEKETEKPGKETKKKEKTKPVDLSHIPQKELAGGLKVRDVVVGNGPDVKKGQKIKMRYIGRLTDGSIFDKNTAGKPFSFELGAGEVIKGWDEGILGMKVGGERELMIPPALGYGKRKSGPIPPNSTLKFEVKVLGAN